MTRPPDDDKPAPHVRAATDSSFDGGPTRALTDVARMHYEHGMTHREIAESIGTSRVRVTRMLAEARRTGIVEITIHGDPAPFPNVGADLAQRFGLVRALVAPSMSDAARTRRSVAMLTAQLLADCLAQSRLLALGLSSTVASAVELLPTISTPDVALVPAAGGWAGPATGLNPEELTSRIAVRTGGTSYNLLAPLLAPSEEFAERIRAEKMVRAGLERAAGADTLVTSVGGMVWEQSALADAVSPEERAELQERGAVGDTSGRFFDAAGAAVSSALDRRVVGLTLEQMVGIPTRLVVAHGPQKVAALRGALAAGLPTHLVTDLETARQLLIDA